MSRLGGPAVTEGKRPASWQAETHSDLVALARDRDLVDADCRINQTTSAHTADGALLPMCGRLGSSRKRAIPEMVQRARRAAT
jgi:hypothetical protein